MKPSPSPAPMPEKPSLLAKCDAIIADERGTHGGPNGYAKQIARELKARLTPSQSDVEVAREWITARLERVELGELSRVIQELAEFRAASRGTRALTEEECKQFENLRYRVEKSAALKAEVGFAVDIISRLTGEQST